jgi:hypothetical protein
LPCPQVAGGLEGGVGDSMVTALDINRDDLSELIRFKPRTQIPLVDLIAPARDVFRGVRRVGIGHWSFPRIENVFGESTHKSGSSVYPMARFNPTNTGSYNA